MPHSFYLLILSLVLFGMIWHLSAQDFPPCTKEDFTAKYNDCEDGKRDIIFYKRRPCSGGVEAPYTNATIPCGMFFSFFKIHHDQL